MRQLELLSDEPEAIEIRARVFQVHRSRSTVDRACDYCESTILSGETVWTESQAKTVGCCAACAKSAARIKTDY